MVQDATREAQSGVQKDRDLFRENLLDELFTTQLYQPFRKKGSIMLNNNFFSSNLDIFKFYLRNFSNEA